MTVVGDKGKHYHEISVTIPTADVDPVANYIIENISSGLLLEDVEEDSHTTIKFYAAEEMEIESRLAGLKKYLAEISPSYDEVELRTKTIKDLDWIEAYKKTVVPVFVGDSIVIKPPWNEDLYPGRMELFIEPKMAFGTGRHESTRGSLARMEKIEFSGKTVLDLGCGSGVLSIYAAKRGAASVIGFDIDPLAVENSHENFELNHVTTICSVSMGRIEDISEDKRFDVIIVNIIKAVIVPIIGDLKGHLTPGGILILAGLLDQDRKEIEATLTENDMTSFETSTDNDWITYMVYRT